MVTSTEEQTLIEDKVKPSGDAEDASSGTEISDESTTDDETSPDDAKAKDDSDAASAPRTFTEGTDEFTAEVDRLAKSKNDKQLAPLFEENKTLKAKVAELETSATHRSEDSALDRLEAAEKDQHTDTPEVLDIQTTRRQVITMGRDNEIEKTRLDTLALQLVDVEKDHQAWQKVMPLLLPDDPTQIAKVNDLVAKLKAATNEAHMDSIWEGIERDLRDMKKAEAVGKAKVRRPKAPESSLATTGKSADDKEFLKGWGSGSIPMTAENQKRADRIHKELSTTT